MWQTGGVKNNFGKSGEYKAVMIASGGLSGGLSSSIAGGNFWDGVKQGLITSGLNHLAHEAFGGKDPFAGCKAEAKKDENGKIIGYLYKKMAWEPTENHPGLVNIHIGFKATPYGAKLKYQVVQNITSDHTLGVDNDFVNLPHIDPSERDPTNDHYPFYLSKNDILAGKKLGYDIYFNDAPEWYGGVIKDYYFEGETSLVSYGNGSIELIHTYRWGFSFDAARSPAVIIFRPIQTSPPSQYQQDKIK
jgi:hypothetical protein